MWGGQDSLESLFLFLSHWILWDWLSEKKKKRKTELPVNIKSSIEYNWLWFACDEKIAGLFIFLLKISSIIKVFFMKKKERCGCFLTESFLHPKACCYGLWHQTKIYFFMSQPRVMPYRCLPSYNSCNNERNIRKSRFRMHKQANKQNSENTSMLLFDFHYGVVTPTMHRDQKMQFVVLPLTWLTTPVA